MLNAYQVAKLITDTHQAQKLKAVQINGQFRYIVKGLSDADYAFYNGGEDFELANGITGDKPKPSSWFMLDAFSASAVKQVFEALTTDETRAKFDRISLPRLVHFAFGGR